jgi:hypothetical protein
MLITKSSLKINTICILTMVLLLFSGCSPYIRTLNPENGAIGSTVTINGGRFGKTTAENTIKFANTTVPVSDVILVSKSQINVKVPDGATTGRVSVTTVNGTGLSSKDFVVDINGSAKWTFMVYLDADNNLESAGIDDFLEMSSVGSRNGVNIILQMDRIDGNNTSYGNWKDTRRFLVKNGDTPQTEPLQNMGELNMGDPDVLQDFIEWAVTNYPAEHYALAIWNHGDGWRKSIENIETISTLKRAGTEEILVKAVASDDTDNDVLYMREVQEAISNALQNLESMNNSDMIIDVVGFDACLMGMVEVGYAIRNGVNYMVGSEELEPGDGWPYNTILTGLTDDPSMTAGNLAKSIVINYGNSYSSGVTQAAYDLSKIDTLAQKIDNFTAVANTNWTALKTARNNSKQYHPDWSLSCWGTDLWDFADKTLNYSTSSIIKNAASELKISIDNFVIQEFHSNNMGGSHGVAIYFPPDLSSFNNDPQHKGYEQSNTFMPVDFVLNHQFDNWLQLFYTNTD